MKTRSAFLVALTAALGLAPAGAGAESRRLPYYQVDSAGREAEYRPHRARAWYADLYFRPAPPADAGAARLARALDSTWKNFTVLSPAMFPPEAAEDSVMMREWYAFARGGDFNRNGAPDTALVGVYTDAQGEDGSFFAILEKRRGVWRKAFLKTYPAAFFNALGKSGSELHLLHCMECDHGVRVRWNGKAYRLKDLLEAE